MNEKAIQKNKEKSIPTIFSPSTEIASERKRWDDKFYKQEDIYTSHFFTYVGFALAILLFSTYVFYIFNYTETNSTRFNTIT